MMPDEGTIPVESRAQSYPLAASTPCVRGQSPWGDSRSVFANVPYVHLRWLNQP